MYPCYSSKFCFQIILYVVFIIKNTIAVGGILGLKTLTGDMPYLGSGNSWINYPRIALGGASLYSSHPLWGHDHSILEGYYNPYHVFNVYGNRGDTYGGHGNAGSIFGGYSNADSRFLGYGNMGGIFNGYDNVGVVTSKYDNAGIYSPYQLLTTTKSPNSKSNLYYKGRGNPWLIQ
ncbi:unnamed protein product [Onchocerca flexuosa]|uniref:Uncharacterized protein n=1 Tax=Onchocerca flexuosa TaxID=387005 RepID=A0A183HN95_9BILA|nr:unnamed protein product [Onchocerca flexuosa]